MTPRPAARDASPSRWQLFYDIIARIPAGRVATYGQIARLAGLPRHARQVGYALAALPAERDDAPWQRVINARGEVSPRAHGGVHRAQQAFLEAEGVVFVGGRVDLRQFQWEEEGA